MDYHIYITMLTESVDMKLRKICAAMLLASPDSQIRSDAYWFKERGHMPIYTAITGWQKTHSSGRFSN